MRLRECGIVLLIGWCSRQAALAQSADEVLAALKTASAQTSLLDDGLKPWHLKIAVTFSKPDGTSEAGTVEEWHNSPSDWRRVYDFPSYRVSSVRKGGIYFRTAGAPRIPYPLEYLFMAVLKPLPKPEDWTEKGLSLVKPGFSSNRFVCADLGNALPLAEAQAHDTRTAYCLDAKTLRFEVTVEYHSLATVRNQVGTFLGRTVPTRLTITAGGKPWASEQITTLQGRAEPYPEALVTEGLAEDDPPPMNEPRIAATPGTGGITPGAILSKVQPVYPEVAKLRPIMGTVWLHAIIGRDGHVKELEVITSPSPDLTDAAMSAVRQWTYRPYLLNGAPVEVDTTVAVNFELGR